MGRIERENTGALWILKSLSNQSYGYLEEAITWYEKKRKGLGKRFFENFQEAIEKVKTRPNLYANVIPEVKRVLIRKFPYKVFFTISDKTIFIIGLLMQKEVTHL